MYHFSGQWRDCFRMKMLYKDNATVWWCNVIVVKVRVTATCFFNLLQFLSCCEMFRCEMCLFFVK